jgi:hypothetical protein
LRHSAKVEIQPGRPASGSGMGELPLGGPGSLVDAGTGLAEGTVTVRHSRAWESAGMRMGLVR